jgi:hypothetical protein
MIDIRKKYQTRSGEDVHILTTDGRTMPRYPVEGFIGKGKETPLQTWALDGRYSEHPYDLVEVPQVRKPDVAEEALKAVTALNDRVTRVHDSAMEGIANVRTRMRETSERQGSTLEQHAKVIDELNRRIQKLEQKAPPCSTVASIPGMGPLGIASCLYQEFLGSYTTPPGSKPKWRSQPDVPCPGRLVLAEMQYDGPGMYKADPYSGGARFLSVLKHDGVCWRHQNDHLAETRDMGDTVYRRRRVVKVVRWRYVEGL